MSSAIASDDQADSPPEPSILEPVPAGRRRRLIVAAAVLLVSGASALLWFAHVADGYRVESTGVDGWGGITITAGGSTELCLPNRPDQMMFMQFGLHNPGEHTVTVTAVTVALGFEADVSVEWGDDLAKHDFPMTLRPDESRQILVTVRRDAAHQLAVRAGQSDAHYYTDRAEVAFRVLGTDHHQSVPFRGPGGFWLGVDDATPPAKACDGHVTGH